MFISYVSMPCIFMIAHVPVRILQCDAVNRQITFHSDDPVQNLSLTQSVFVEPIPSQFTRSHTPPSSSSSSSSSSSFNEDTEEDDLGEPSLLLEEWYFNFGFVIPNSTNSWEQIIQGNVNPPTPPSPPSSSSNEKVVISREGKDGDESEDSDEEDKGGIVIHEDSEDSEDEEEDGIPSFNPIAFSGRIVMDTVFKDNDEKELLRLKIRLFYVDDEKDKSEGKDSLM